MTSDVMVRPAHQADVPGIQDVADEAWHAAYDDILGADVVDEVLDEWYVDDAIEEGVSHDAQDFAVAVSDETVVGYVHVGPHPPRRVHQLYRLYVHPDHWDEGIGKALLAEAEQALYDRDLNGYEVEVYADNERAVGFFEGTGFERVEEDETTFWGVTLTEYIYRKRL
jgi:ribosomal protein S18 acetylase RimI-like enzyme